MILRISLLYNCISPKKLYLCYDLSSYATGIVDNELSTQMITEGFNFIPTEARVIHRRSSYYDEAELSRDNQI